MDDDGEIKRKGEEWEMHGRGRKVAQAGQSHEIDQKI